MGVSDGKVLKTTKIVDKGSNNECFNIVLIAEGFKSDEQKKFEGYCDNFVKAFNQTSPFKDCATKINIYRINISSTESGADDPKKCGNDTSGTGIKVRTYLDATFCAYGQKIRRLLGFNKPLALQVLTKNVKEWHRALIIVNTTKLGGAGGSIAITSVHSGWTLTALHELGHTFGLADEYQDYYSCPPPQHPSQDKHPPTEPAEPNVTIKTKRHDIKWRHLILPQTPIPTLTNPDCKVCNILLNPRPAGTVGLYEGAHYYHCKAYRSSYNCMMRNYANFCAVCQRQIRKKIAPFIKTSDLAITPWGYAQTPPRQPYWQTPDIWGNPVRGQSKNDLHIRVYNVGKVKSPPFKVRVSYVPFTTMIDQKNEVIIGVFNRPALADGASDHFIVNWDLTPPGLPEKFATYNHFCVIAQILANECNTTNNKAQNNFANVPLKKGSSPPPPVKLEVVNPWEEDAIAQLILSSDDDRLVLEALNFSPEGFLLTPNERREVEVALNLADGVIDQIQPMEANFEITQLLNHQIVGGVSGSVVKKTCCRLVLGGPVFDYASVPEVLLYAVPWKDIIDRVFPGEDLPVMVELMHGGLLTEDAHNIRHDPEYAKELLAQTGFKEGFHLYLLFLFEDEAVTQVVDGITEALTEIHVGTYFSDTPPTNTLAKMEAMADAGMHILWISR